MNEVRVKLKADAEAQRELFSSSRHSRLVDALKTAPLDGVEAPLRSPRDLRAISAVIALALCVGTGWWIARPAESVPLARIDQELGVPILIAERSYASAGRAASAFAARSDRAFDQQADAIFSFLSSQASIARSLAVEPSKAKPPA